MNTVITIGREFGSGGHQIGTILAKKFGIPCYDKQLLERASSESGIAKELFEKRDEKSSVGFLHSLVMDTYVGGYSANNITEMPIDQKIFLAQFETIKKLAQEGPCVIIGRCADYALELEPNRLSVFVYANLDMRIRRIAKIYELTNQQAREQITKIDKKRASYYNYYTNKEWGKLGSYDLSVDSSIMGIDGTAELIANAVMIHERDRQAITEPPFDDTVPIFKHNNDF